MEIPVLSVEKQRTNAISTSGAMTWQTILRRARARATSRYARRKLLHASEYLAAREAEDARLAEAHAPRDGEYGAVFS
jgi:hypothetical protein